MSPFQLSADEMKDLFPKVHKAVFALQPRFLLEWPGIKESLHVGLCSHLFRIHFDFFNQDRAGFFENDIVLSGRATLQILILKM